MKTDRKQISPAMSPLWSPGQFSLLITLALISLSVSAASWAGAATDCEPKDAAAAEKFRLEQETLKADRQSIRQPASESTRKMPQERGRIGTKH